MAKSAAVRMVEAHQTGLGSFHQYYFELWLIGGENPVVYDCVAQSLGEAWLLAANKASTFDRCCVRIVSKGLI